jgi:hypothetical protein
MSLLRERSDLMETPLDKQSGNDEFDAIVIGSGAGGATVARELSKRGQKVLILERGGNAPLREGLLGAISVFSGVRVGGNVTMARALTTGGSTTIYLGATARPSMDSFQSLGIDLSKELEEAENELPLATLPDAMLRPPSLKLRDSAIALGYELYTRRMLVDQSVCSSGYSYRAKWTARNYVEDAVRNGATLLNGATALRVLTDQGRAIGVEYALQKTKRQTETHRVFGAKIVVAAGCAPTPVLLRKSGIRNVADRGFAIHPGFAVFGTISGLKGTEGFGASWGFALDDEIHIGDGNFDRTVHRLIMLGERKWLRVFRYASTITAGVLVIDSLGGELREDGRYHKELTSEDKAKLAKGDAAARHLLEHAGGRDLYTTPVSASCIAGTLRIQEHVDANLQTEIRDLYVCDGSLMPREGMTPALTLICLGKYLANHLARAH